MSPVLSSASRTWPLAPAGVPTRVRLMTSGELAGLLVRLALGTACASALACILGAHLIWNWTPSMPRGLYWLSRGSADVHRGDLVAFPIPRDVEALVRERHYLPPGALLLKPVVAVAGDDVCTDGGVLVVCGAALGAVLTADTHGRPLPQARLCGPLPEGVVFLASHHPQSFDSRTFGPVDMRLLQGTVTPLWTY